MTSTTKRNTNKHNSRSALTAGLFMTLAVAACASIAIGSVGLVSRLSAASGGAQDDSFVFTSGQPVTIDVLGNDTLSASNVRISQLNDQHVAPGQTVSITGGTLTLNGDNTVTFAPNPGFTGTPTFTYGLESLQTSQLETFDLPGQTTGDNVPLMLATPPNNDYSVESGLGVGGSNAFLGIHDWNAPIAPTLPTVVDLATLGSNTEIIVSMDAMIDSEACVVVGVAGGCNEALVGLMDASVTTTVSNAMHNVLLGVVSDHGGIIAREVIENQVEDQDMCDAAGGRLAPFNASLMFCWFVSEGLASPFEPVPGQFYNLMAIFRVESGDLIADLVADGQFIQEVNMGQVALRSWWNDMLPAYWVDDTVDNLQVQYFVDLQAGATVTGTWQPTPDSPDTGFAR
jgi:hypothetical protein